MIEIGMTGVFFKFAISGRAIEKFRKRIWQMQDGLNVLKNNLFTGVGSYGWKDNLFAWRTHDYEVNIIHNSYLHIGVKYGIIVLSMIFILTSYLIFCSRNWTNTRQAILYVGTSIIHPSTEGVFLLCNILDLLIYSCNVILKVASKQTKKELSGVVSMVSETEILKERFYNVFLARKRLRIYVTVFLFGIIILSFSEMQIARQIWSSSHIENCPKCKAAVQGEVVWNAWENEKNVVCTHQYAWGDDLQKARYGVEKIRCNECGNFFEIKIRQEKIVCHGYND